MSARATCLLTFAFILLLTTNLPAQEVSITMSDGVTLVADLYLPPDSGPVPVVVIRTPYHKQNKRTIAEYFVEQGYAALVQDVRGKFKSEGHLSFHKERQDGLETVEWIVQQPWCNGNIAFYGPSYLGYTALAAASTGHPAIKAVFVVSAVKGTYEPIHVGGAFHLEFSTIWAYAFDKKGQRSAGGFDWSQLYRHRPVRDILSSIGDTNNSTWDLMVSHPDMDAVQMRSDVGVFSDVKVPTYHLTGWNDFIYDETFMVFEDMMRNPWYKKNKAVRLKVGPWYHDQTLNGGTKAGDMEYGPQATTDTRPVLDQAVRWFDYWISGKDDGISAEPAVEFFVMGANGWGSDESWPPKQTELQQWFVSSTNGANSLGGDGILSLQQPAMEGQDRYVFDPDDPVPTRGGANFHWFVNKLGPRDQRMVEQRKDVLVYTSSVLEEDVAICGPVKATVFASTEGTDTDFTAKLVDVHPDGYAMNVVDGIKRGRYRNSYAKPELLRPGKVYQITVDLGHTAYLFKKGHRIRLDISSSNFPKYTLNPNTGEVPEFATDFRKVGQTIYHSSDYPTHITLPVVPHLTLNDPANTGTRLADVAVNRSLAAMEKLLEGGIDIDARDPGGKTALMWVALTKGDLIIARALLDRGADVNAFDTEGNTSLIYSTRNGHSGLVTLLLDRGADIDHVNTWSEGGSALRYAVGKGSIELVNLLLARGADVNRKTASGHTPLHQAAHDGRDNLIPLLLAAGAEVNAADEDGITPLMYAASHGRESIVRNLLTAGADTGMKTMSGKSARDYAVEGGYTAVAQLLGD